MTVVSDYDFVLSCLGKVLHSPIFASAPKQQKILEYLVKESYAGNGRRLKGYTVAIEALGARPEFDSNHDSSLRVTAKRLRKKLCEYYQDWGEADTVRFHLAIGSYEIIFLRKLTCSQSLNNLELVVTNQDRRSGCDRRITVATPAIPQTAIK